VLRICSGLHVKHSKAIGAVEYRLLSFKEKITAANASLSAKQSLPPIAQPSSPLALEASSLPLCPRPSPLPLGQSCAQDLPACGDSSDFLSPRGRSARQGSHKIESLVSGARPPRLFHEHRDNESRKKETQFPGTDLRVVCQFIASQNPLPVHCITKSLRSGCLK